MAEVKDNILEINKVYQELNKTIQENIQRLERGARAVTDYNQALNIAPSAFNRSILDMNRTLQRLSASLQQLQTAQGNVSSAERENARTREALNREQISAINLSERQRRASEQQARDTERQTRANERLNSAYQQLSRQEQSSARTVQDLIARGRSATQTQREFNRELVNAQREHQQLQRRVLEADRAVGRFQRNVGNYASAFRGLGNLMGAFGIAGGLTLFAGLVTDTIKLIKELQGLNMALNQVSGSAQQFAINQNFIKTTSENLGLGINELTRQFTQFYVSAKNKMSQKEIEGIFTSIAKAGATMGLSVDAQNRAFIALNQMMSKGTITAEELKGQLGEALPGAFGIMAKAVGVSEKELGKLMQQGKVGTEVLPAFARELEKAYGIENITNVKTLNAETNRMNNAWIDFIASIETGNGVFSKVLVKLISFITDGIKGIKDFSNQFTVYFEKIGKAFDILYPKSQFLSKAFEFLGNVIKNVIIFPFKQVSFLVDGIAYSFGVLIPIAIIKTKASFEILKLTFFSFIDLLKNTVPEAVKLMLDFLNPFKKADASGLSNAINKTQKDYLTALNKITGEQNKNSNAIIKNWNEQKKLNEIETKAIETKINNTSETNKNNTAKEKNNKIAKEERKIVEGSVEWYEKLISQLKQEQSQLATTNGEYNGYNVVIDAMIAKLNKLIGVKKELAKTESDPMTSISISDEELMKNAYKIEEEFFNFSERMKAKGIDLMSNFASNTGFTTTFEILNKQIEGFGENWLITTDAILTASSEMYSFLNSMGEDNFQAEYERENRRKENALMFAGDSAEAKAEIERESERRMKEIKKREAQAQKKQAIFQATIDMVKGIMGAVAANPLSLGMPQSAIIGAIGIANIARINSQQIPEYWKGTDNAQEGIAWTNERGREIIKDAQGRIKDYGTDKGATLKYLNKGDKVLKHSDTMRELDNILLQNNINKPLNNNINIDLLPLQNDIKNLTNIIANKSEITIIKDMQGERYFNRVNGQRQELKNTILNLKTRNV